MNIFLLHNPLKINELWVDHKMHESSYGLWLRNPKVAELVPRLGKALN